MDDQAPPSGWLGGGALGRRAPAQERGLYNSNLFRRDTYWVKGEQGRYCGSGLVQPIMTVAPALSSAGLWLVSQSQPAW